MILIRLFLVRPPPDGYAVHVPKGTGDATLETLNLVPASNRAAWRLHHVTANDTLATIARTYNTAAERIISVNSTQAANLTAGDTLLIPANFHDEQTRASSSASHSSARSTRTAARSSVTHPAGKLTITRHAAHVAASRRVPAQMLRRKAAVHTASVRH